MDIIRLLIISLAIAISVPAYEIPDENEYITKTCQINVKTTVIPDHTMKLPTGRSVITITLTDNEGNPHRKEAIRVSANAGTFICTLPSDTATTASATSNDCFTTGHDGKASLYLINIPFNTQIKVTASYDCGEQTVTSFATMSISRKKLHRKKKGRVIPKVR